MVSPQTELVRGGDSEETVKETKMEYFYDWELTKQSLLRALLQPKNNLQISDLFVARLTD